MSTHTAAQDFTPPQPVAAEKADLTSAQPMKMEQEAHVTKVLTWVAVPNQT